jgi:hypothetical protein
MVYLYFPQILCEGIELVAKMEKTGKKDAVRLIMETGLSKYKGDKVSQHIQNDNNARLHNMVVQGSRFMMIVRRCAKANGLGPDRLLGEINCHETPKMRPEESSATVSLTTSGNSQ